jgi:hypothetical protein
LSFFVFPWLTLTSFNITLLFLGRFNRMATGTDSLAPGLDGHVLRLGIGRKKLGKSRVNPRNLISVHLLFQCRLCSHCTSKMPYYLAHFLCPLPLTLFEPPVSSPLLHCFGH